MRIKDSTLFKSNKFVYQKIGQFVFLINPLTTVEFSGKRWQSIGIDTVFITRPVLSTSCYKKKVYDRNNNCLMIKNDIIVSFF